MSERMKITVKEVGEPKDVGTKGAKKLQFKAVGSDGKELDYFTFSTRLFEYIKKDAVLDIELEVGTHEYNGTTYTDRKVTQIYENGQPVGGQRQSGGGWGGRPDNSASIESQVAAKIAGELLVAKIISPTDALGKQVIDWCSARLGAKPAGLKPETRGNTEDLFPEAPQAQNKPVEAQSNPPAVKNTGYTTADLLTWVANVKGFKSTTTARKWLNALPLKIENKRIDSEPEKVHAEIKDLVR